MTTIVVAALGVGTGLGLLLICWGLSGTATNIPTSLQAVSRETWSRLGACVAVAAVVGAATRWPVGAVLAGLATWTLPTLLGGDKAQAKSLARTEAVASWAEMLRDNLRSTRRPRGGAGGPALAGGLVPSPSAPRSSWP